MEIFHFQTKSSEALKYIFQNLKKNNLSKFNLLDKIKIIYLADKDFLIKYNKTITNDTYIALENGPYLKELMKLNILYPSIKEQEIELNKEINLKLLTKNDINELNFIIEKYGNLDMEHITHLLKDRTWKLAWDKKGDNKELNLNEILKYNNKFNKRIIKYTYKAYN